jgi:hypothetical protein
MRTVAYVLCLLLSIAVTSCKKESAEQQEVYPKFPPPTWKEDDSGRYPASMTAVVSLPLSFRADFSKNDQLAAFVNDECRGVGALVELDTASVYFVLIRGLADEQSPVMFKYYNVKSSYLYQTSSAVNFLVDKVYGTAQNPQVLELTPVK